MKQLLCLTLENQGCIGSVKLTVSRQTLQTAFPEPLRAPKTEGD
jgi:hypothetical protein